MAPANRRRGRGAAQLSGLGQTFALDHRPGVIEPPLLLAQMRHRGLGQRVECAPATLAAKSKARASGPSPTTSPPAQCGHPWLSTRSWLGEPSASSRRPRLVALPGGASRETSGPERA
jgi:hypothetical protein